MRLDFGSLWLRPRLTACHPPTLPDRISADQDQDRAAHVLGDVAEVPGHSLAKEQAGDRHQSLEQAEGDADAKAGAGADATQADADCTREIAQPDRDADQQKPQKTRHFVGW